MELTLETLTNWLEIEDPRTQDLRTAILISFDNHKAMRKIIDQQCENREQTHCYTCEREAGCLILNGIAYLALGEINIAIKELEYAGQHFRGKGENWNQIISLVLLGIAYEKNRKDHQALREFEKAHLEIKSYLRIHSKDYLGNAIDLEKELKDRVTNTDTNSKKEQQTNADSGRLSLPWIPPYTGLQAGPDGPVWVGLPSEDSESFIDNIILANRVHEIYPLKQNDDLISLTKNRNYGWAKVTGNSMNNSKPLPILEDDFVLFYESPVAEHNAIVIASLPENLGSGYKYVVKRYSKRDQMLISETEPPGSYAPIPMNKEASIIGVVIAIAKAKR